MENRFAELIIKIRTPLYQLYDAEGSGDLANYSPEVGQSEYKVRYGLDLIRVLNFTKIIEKMFSSQPIRIDHLKDLRITEIEFYEMLVILFNHLAFESREKLAQFINLFFELNLDVKGGEIDTRGLIKKLKETGVIKKFGLDKNLDFYDLSKNSKTASRIDVRNKDLHDFYWSGYDSNLMMTKILESSKEDENNRDIKDALEVMYQQFPHKKDWLSQQLQDMKEINQEIFDNLEDVANKLNEAVDKGVIKIYTFGF